LLGPYLRRRRVAAAQPLMEGRVLDVGCNRGVLCEVVPPDRYLGVDINREALAEAQRQYPNHRFAHVDDVGPDEQFDSVVSLAVIEHVPEPEAWLSRWGAHVVPGGRVILTTPTPRWEPLHGLASKLRLTSESAHDAHVSVLDRAGLEAVLAVAGLELTHYSRFLAGMNQLVVATR
jgi:2-polyprenyl-3-methyl-5-hydroxy-6-metoxy-1,4-benzoquinol methylase